MGAAAEHKCVMSVRASRFWFAYDGKGITMTFYGYESRFEKQEPQIEYSFKSLHAIEGE